MHIVFNLHRFSIRCDNNATQEGLYTPTSPLVNEYEYNDD